ncbi:MAG: hypothetical protein Q4E12_05015 [Coriobacteriia bacterium]|nr:hypothetical protein [Coriobacteriia bacterium]
MTDSDYKTMRNVGGWCIVLGTITIVAGLTLGVGCLVSGGRLLSK